LWSYACDRHNAQTADLATAELAEALGALRFHGKSRCLVSLDKDVRDYLLRAIRAR